MDPILERDHFIFFEIPYKDIRVQRDWYIPGVSCLTQPTQNIRHSKFYILQLYLENMCSDTKTFALTTACIIIICMNCMKLALCRITKTLS